MGAAEGFKREAGAGIGFARLCPALAGGGLAEVVDEGEEVVEVYRAAAVEVVGRGVALGWLAEEVDEEEEVVEGDGAVAVEVAG